MNDAENGALKQECELLPVIPLHPFNHGLFTFMPTCFSTAWLCCWTFTIEKTYIRARCKIMKLNAPSPLLM